MVIMLVLTDLKCDCAVNYFRGVCDHILAGVAIMVACMVGMVVQS